MENEIDLEYIVKRIATINKKVKNYVKNNSPSSCRLTGDQMRLLFLIKDNDLNQKKLASILSITPATLSVRINTLQKEGMIERQVDNQDRRNFRLALTKEAIDLVEKEGKFFKDLKYELIKNFNSDDLNKIDYLFKKMEKNLQEIEGGKHD